MSLKILLILCVLFIKNNWSQITGPTTTTWTFSLDNDDGFSDNGTEIDDLSTFLQIDDEFLKSVTDDFRNIVESSVSTTTTTTIEKILKLHEINKNPELIASLPNGKAHFSIEICGKDFRSNIPADAEIVTNPSNLNITWKSKHQQLNNSLFIDFVSNLARLVIVKDDATVEYFTRDDVNLATIRSDNFNITFGTNVAVIFNNFRRDEHNFSYFTITASCLLLLSVLVVILALFVVYRLRLPIRNVLSAA